MAVRITKWPPKPPYDLPRHRVRPRGRPPVTQLPQGGLGPEFSQYRPICTPSLSRHPRAPPARAAHPRHPLVPPVRAARSRCPLAPSARAATSPHRHQTLMVSLDFPIPSHLHTPVHASSVRCAVGSATRGGEHERGAGNRASRGDFTQALRSPGAAPPAGVSQLPPSSNSAADGGTVAASPVPATRKRKGRGSHNHVAKYELKRQRRAALLLTLQDTGGGT